VGLANPARAAGAAPPPRLTCTAYPHNARTPPPRRQSLDPLQPALAPPSPPPARARGAAQPAAAAAAGCVYATPEEAAALVAWQQQVYYQHQLAAAEALPAPARRQHMGGRAAGRAGRGAAAWVEGCRVGAQPITAPLPLACAAAVVQQLQQAASVAVTDPGSVSRQLSALLLGGHGGAAAAAAAAAVTGSGCAGAAGGGGAVPDELAYSKKPRAVKFTPYGLRDYEDRYDVKRTAGYWELGRLGPENESEELLAKVRGRPPPARVGAGQQ
jgi:hypothetical protein